MIGRRPALISQRVARGLPLALLLLLGLALAAWSGTPPAVIPATAPPTDFSAARAMETVRLVSVRPHPIGSPEAAAVRAALTARLRAMGLTVLPLDAVGASVSIKAPGGSAKAARVETLLATLPGTDPALPPVAIMVHTDSVQDSFGAADDGAGVAVALETARAIAAGPRGHRDLLLILTDGEEAGLLGARSYFADETRARRIGAIVNIDSRGTGGLGAMFETGPGSGGLIALYRRTATNRFAHSAATFLYHQLPNSTDLTAAKGRDVPALNFAFLDGEFDYHTPRDRLASLDPRTLQSLGDQVLPVVRAVAADAALPPRGDDGVFGDAPGIAAFRYPTWVGWPLLAAALLLGGWGVAGAGFAGTARSAGATVWVAVAAALFAGLGYGLTGVGGDWAAHHFIMAAFTRYEAGLGLAALACVLAGGMALQPRPFRGGVGVGPLNEARARGEAPPPAPHRRSPVPRTGPRATMRLKGRGVRVAVLCAVAGIAAVLLGRPPLPTAIIAGAAAMLALLTLGRPVAERELRAGTLTVVLLLSAFLQLKAPALTPLILWPTLAAAIMAALARAFPGRGWIGAAVALLPLAYTLSFAHAVLLALGIPTPEAVALFALVGFILIAPLTARSAWPAAGAATVAAILLLAFRWTPATERHPVLTQVWGVREADGRSWRVSTLEGPGDWTRAALASDGGTIARATMPIIEGDPLWRAPARPIPLPPPGLTLTRDGPVTALTVTPASGGGELRLLLRADRPLVTASVEGTALPGFAATVGQWRLRWSSGGPVTLRFTAPAGATLTAEAAEVTERRIPVPPRAATIVPWLGSDRIITLAKGAWHIPPVSR